MGPAGIPDLVTADSDPEDWLWKTVRKGVAPAFAAQAMRSVDAVCKSTPCLQPHSIGTYLDFNAFTILALKRSLCPTHTQLAFTLDSIPIAPNPKLASSDVSNLTISPTVTSKTVTM